MSCVYGALLVKFVRARLWLPSAFITWTSEYWIDPMSSLTSPAAHPKAIVRPSGEYIGLCCCSKPRHPGPPPHPGDNSRAPLPSGLTVQNAALSSAFSPPGWRVNTILDPSGAQLGSLSRP